eukprot:TRINITY_DN1600_c0_g1_i1.p1 TRINITY_DN1600_c0_g1~~TRINITY_DN1600_c0_g1_i1.p1  ORF type:complete len:326 (+),score=58.85 TRINITY_DN1600_c0_g1_i1:135-1112(+)
MSFLVERRLWMKEDADSLPASSDEFEDVEWDQIHIPKFVAWVTAGHFAEHLLTYPLWVIKTRRQTSKEVPARHPFGSATFAEMREIKRTEGLRKGLYRGFTVSAISSTPGDIIYLMSYNFFKSAAKDAGFGDLWAPAVAATFAEVTTNIINVPVDVVVQRMQLPNCPYNNSADAVRQIFATEGFRGFYRGFAATLVAWTPASAFWWFSYEYLKRGLYPYRPWEKYSGREHNRNYFSEIVAGALSGSLTMAIFNPLEVVKTRLQTQPYNLPHDQKIHGIWDGIKKLIKEEGLTGMTRGLAPRIIMRAPLSAVSAMAYEIMIHNSQK